MVKKNDLSAYRKDSKAVLQTPIDTVAQVQKKRGPKPVAEKRSAKVLLSFTEAEIGRIKDKAGLVPVATYIVSILKEQGTLD